MRSTTINGKTELYAIFGTPIGHSMSPVIMNTFFEQMGMDKVFIALNAGMDTFDRVMEGCMLAGFKGYVFTMPVKEKAVRFMDALSDEAAIIGAVNCARNDNGKLTGYNTDSIGFWQAIATKRSSAAPPIKALVLGAGGFARSAAAQMAIQGIRDIVVSNMLSDTAFVKSFRDFAGRLEQKCPATAIRLIDWSPALWAEELPGCGVVANGTPNGMKDEGDLHAIFPYDRVDGDAVVFDAIYEPRFTRFLKAAEACGLTVVEGLDLLAYQAAVSFYNWTGITVDPEQMKDAVLRFMATRKG